MREVAAEGILLAAGARAILLQVADPAIARGVAEHSDFASRPLDRLSATMSYVYGVVFGTPDEIDYVSRGVEHTHRRVVGRGYDASDAGLQLWVAATLYQSAVQLYEIVFGPLPSARAERVYAQYAVLGTALQVAPSDWPSDRATFDAYWQQRLAELTVTAEARGIARDLLYPKSAVLRPLAPVNRLITAGLVPPPLRDSYQLPWNLSRQRRFDALMAGVRTVYPLLPTPLRALPKTYYLHRVRRAMSRRHDSR